jgi:hypothetical protein
MPPFLVIRAADVRYISWLGILHSVGGEGRPREGGGRGEEEMRRRRGWELVDGLHWDTGEGTTAAIRVE